MAGSQNRSRPAWTTMLADIVALMLAFFVLAFSMREIVPVRHGPVMSESGFATSIASLDATPVDQHRALEQGRADAPSFAYLAAIVENSLEPGLRPPIHHDDMMLVIDLAGSQGSAPAPAPAEPGHSSADRGEPRAPADLGDGERQLVMTLAFLARRFALALHLELAARDPAELAASLVEAAALRSWLSSTTGLASPEIVFAPAALETARSGQVLRAALTVVPVRDARASSIP